jgi:putative endopeptidase
MKRSVVLLAWIGAACGGTQASAPEPAPAAAAPTPKVATPAARPSAPVDKVSLRDVGLDPEKMDPSANPCDDFYRYACGGFLDKAQIPADEALWGTFNMLAQKNRDTLHAILEQAAKSPGDDPVQEKIGAFYGSCMDEPAVEKAGTKAIEPLLSAARKVKDVRTLAAAVATLHKAGVGVLFRARDEQDRKDATKVIFGIVQAGLGMPDRDYYLKDDDKSKTLRDEYVGHVERTLTLLGHKDAKKAAADVVALETELAKNHRPRNEMRDADKTYNRMDRAGVEKALPALEWKRYFATLGAPEMQEIDVSTPKYIEALEGIMKAHKPGEWRTYLEFHVAETYSQALPKRFADEGFAWQKVISGQKEQKARWKRCVDATDRGLGELLGQPFVKVAFPGDSKEAALMMIKQIARAFGENLASITWMDEATKVKARDKLTKLDFNIGFPENWRKYDFKIDPKNFAANAVAATEFEVRRHLNKIGKPVDKRDWNMTPPTVNAYYTASMNEMFFPAGILQSPFYSVKASIAVNLGGMGMVVGHELTHGYDDQGAKFDGDGNMSSWWPDEVNQKFHEHTQCVVKYYSSYEAAPGLYENGELTQGEDIADMGGVKLALHAYRDLRKEAPKRQVADGLTEDQQFFLSVGQAWCTKASPEYERLQIATNPHALPRFRVDGALSSTPEFAKVWGCQVGTKMNPPNRCEVW